MNLLFIFLLLIPLLYIIPTLIGGGRLDIMKIIIGIAGIGVVLMVGVVVIQNIQQAVLTDPNMQNDPSLKIFQEAFNMFGITSPQTEPVAQIPIEPPSSVNTQETPQTINNTYLNVTEFNNNYNNWKNG